MKKYPKSYGTHNELYFLKGVGTGVFSKIREVSRLEMLRRYLKHIDKCNWGKRIDKKKIISYVKEQIRLLEGR